MGKSLETEENSVQTTRLKRILLSASLAIPVISGATVGYFAVLPVSKFIITNVKPVKGQ